MLYLYPTLKRYFSLKLSKVSPKYFDKASISTIFIQIYPLSPMQQFPAQLSQAVGLKEKLYPFF